MTMADDRTWLRRLIEEPHRAIPWRYTTIYGDGQDQFRPHRCTWWQWRDRVWAVNDRALLRRVK